MSTGHSITAMLSRVKQADRDAVSDLFAKCYPRVAAIGLKKLGGKNHRGFDEDDVANSAFRDFLARARSGKFKKLETSDDVWQILTLLVVDKINERRRHEWRKKRGGGEPDVSLELVSERVSKCDDAGLEADFEDALNVFLEELPSADHRKIVDLLIKKGLTHEQIAKHLELSVRTVHRRFEDIRVVWSRIFGGDAPKKKSSGQRRDQVEASDEHDSEHA